mgnify:CR=1 FL=1
MISTEPRYILWKKIPAITPGGKARKVPVNWMTGGICSAHDRRLWTTYDTAAGFAKNYGPEYGVGFVIEGPYVLLDIDKCLVNGQWSDLANALMARFAGAYLEISDSGEGIHIIAWVRDMPHHACKRDGLELYSTKRFVALTGTDAMGSMDSDQTDAFHSLVQERFLPGAGDVDMTKVEWTTEPSADWAGPTDDDELARKACESRPPASAIFGGSSKPTFRQLWEADGEALGKIYPDHGGQDRPFDGSAAELNLANKLMFWTGRDCERTVRMMRASGLYREKMDREDYMVGTVLRALVANTDVYGSRRTAPPRTETLVGPPAVPVPAPSVAGATPTTPGGGTNSGQKFRTDFPTHFEGVIYIEDREVAAVPDGSLLSPSQFKTNQRYGGARFSLDEVKITRNAWEAFTQTEGWKPPMAHSLCFRPELPPRALVEANGRILFNSYVPANVVATPGDVSLFLRHLELLLPNERDRNFLLSYMAWVLQNPGKKAAWWPVIQGVEGNGKSFINAIMMYGVGEEYSHIPNTQDLGNKFNGYVDRKLWIGIEEIHVSGRGVLDTLKVLVTNPRIEMQKKGSDQVVIDNRANGMCLTNYRDAVPKTGNDRRFGMFFTAQQEASDLVRDGMDARYFARLYGWAVDGGYAHIVHYLRGMAIPDEMNPGTLAHRAPVTSSTADAIHDSRTVAEQAVVEAAESGETGFRGGWVSSYYLGGLLDSLNLRRACPQNSWDRMLKNLGYIRCPALTLGRCSSLVSPDDRRSILWVRETHVLSDWTPALAMDHYSRHNDPNAAVARDVVLPFAKRTG